MTQPDSIWTEEKIVELTRLWAEGIGTVEMGRLLGVSKNAVIGKVHRIGLDPRVILAPPTKPKAFEAYLQLAPNDCRYPLWDAGEPTYEFCGAPAKAGSPYCAQHHARCYIPESSAWSQERREAHRRRMIKYHRSKRELSDAKNEAA